MKQKQTKKPVDPRIKQIMRTFDFKKVQDAMIYLNWTWVTSKNIGFVPTIQELRKTAREYLDRIVGYPNMSKCGTGGFIVEKYEDGIIELRFELDTARGFPLED